MRIPQGQKWSRHLKARGLKMTKSTRMVNYFGRWATSKGHLFTSRQKVIVPLLWRMVIWVRQKRCLSLRKCIMIGATMLAPDARGHGKSQGDYIGFGWPDRKDYVQWIEKVLTENGQQEQITLYGVSMGAATVMMTSGKITR